MNKAALLTTTIFTYLFLLFPKSTRAHVRWFVDESQSLSSNQYKLSDPPVFGFLAFAAASLVAGSFIDRIVSIPKKYLKRLEYIKPYAISSLSVLSGAALVIYSVNGFVLSPVLQTDGNPVGAFLIILQMAIGMFYMSGIYTRFASYLLMSLYMLALGTFGLKALEPFEFIGIALFVLKFGRPKWQVISSKEKSGKFFSDKALSVLRIITGLNFIFLGFNEKILTPGLGMAFLEKYHWNFAGFFLPTLFSDYWFVFFAGAMEALLGLAIVLGIVTRVSALGAAGFFVTTLFLLGIIELTGHLPFFAILFVLIIFGGGNYLRISGSTKEN